jgi:glycosyltransferase involved in cell wall biosynthesis
MVGRREGARVIVGMMRIKNEQRWIARVLDSMMPVCERVFILDDNSTDDTRQICRQFPKVTLFESPFAGQSTQEVRDKNYLIGQVEAEIPAGSWIVAIDGDEQIADGGCDVIRNLTENPSRADSFRFHVKYLWDSESQWRVDGIYAEFYRPSMFRLQPGQRFESSAGGGFHCGNVPVHGASQRVPVHLLHYGYLHRADRLRKFDWYNAPDKQPIPENEDGYRHMVVGDLFPVDAKFRYGGPLALAAL